MKKLFLVIIALVMLLSCVACANNNDGTPKEETFTHDSGISITLNEAFKEVDYNNYTVSYNSANVTVFVLKEDFSLIDCDGYTVMQYADMVRESNSKHSPTAVSEDDDLVSFEYAYFNKEENMAFKYFTAMFKGDDAFWTVQFACKADEYDTLKPEILKYAKSVNVTK